MIRLLQPTAHQLANPQAFWNQHADPPVLQQPPPAFIHGNQQYVDPQANQFQAMRECRMRITGWGDVHIAQSEGLALGHLAATALGHLFHAPAQQGIMDAGGRYRLVTMFVGRVLALNQQQQYEHRAFVTETVPPIIWPGGPHPGPLFQQYRDQVSAAMVARAQQYQQTVNEGDYSAIFLVKSVRLVAIRLPPLAAGCHANDASQSCKCYHFGGAELWAHGVSTQDNNCVFFPFTYHLFRDLHKSPQAPYVNFLEIQRRLFQAFLRGKKEADPEYQPDPSVADSGKAIDICDAFVLNALVEKFGVDLVIFTPWKNGVKYHLTLLVDTRGNPAYAPQTIRRGYFSIVIESTLAPDAQISHHVHAILNDDQSLYYAYKRHCGPCGRTYVFNPEKKHKCSPARANYRRRNLTNWDPACGDLFVCGQAADDIPIQSDIDGDRHDFDLNGKEPLPRRGTVKFNGCKFAPEDHLLFFDLETIFKRDEVNLSAVYAVGFLELWTGEYRSYFGLDCMEHFFTYLGTLPHSVKLIAYNGSRFDSIILARAALTFPGVTVRDFLCNAGSLLSFNLSFKNRPELCHSLWDICKFTLCSLADACKSYGLPIQKSFFPHDFVDSPEKLHYQGPFPPLSFFPEKDRQEASIFIQEAEARGEEFNLREFSLKYLKIDVLVMRDLYNCLQEQFNEVFTPKGLGQIYLTGYFSLSQFSYDVCQYFWVKNNITVYPPGNVPAYDLFKSGYIGGRVEYSSRFWETGEYPAVKEQEGTPEAYEKVGEDYLTYLDATSLYPHMMENYYYPLGKAFFLSSTFLAKLNNIFLVDGVGEITQAQFLTDLLPYFNMDLLTAPEDRRNDYFLPEEAAKLPWHERLACSYWEVSFTPPPTSKNPYHLYKTRGGRLQSDLFPNRQWLYMPDVMAMLQTGYTFTKIHTVVGWVGFGRHLKDVIHCGKEIKENAPNPIQRKIGKSLLNSLYGKFGQAVKDAVVQAVHNFEELMTFSTENIWLEYNAFDRAADEQYIALVRGKRREEHLTTNKPTYLAAFVTSYARYQMRMTFFEEIWKKSPEDLVIYTDTDSGVVHKKSLCHLPVALVVQPGQEDKFGMLKDDLASGSKKYLAYAKEKPSPLLPLKIIRFITIAKKVYFVEYILPDGTIESTQACKGINQDIDAAVFEYCGKNPGLSGTCVVTPFSLAKNFFTTRSLKRAKELKNEEIARKRQKIINEHGNTLAAADLIAALDPEQEITEADLKTNLSFTIQKVINSTRTFNQSAPNAKYVDMDTGEVLPWGHPTITPEREAKFKENFKCSYKHEAAVRFTYKRLKEISLTRDKVIELEGLENPAVEEDEPDEFYGIDLLLGFGDNEYYE